MIDSVTRYSATITAGGLMLPDARRVAALMQSSPTHAQWVQAIGLNNLLQKKAPATASRKANLIRARLELLPASALAVVANGSQEAAAQMMLAGCLKHSTLLTDFMRSVLAAHVRRMDDALVRREWDTFLAECAARDPAVEAWTASTRTKLFQVIVSMLVDAKYIESNRTLKLRTPSLHPEVRSLLKQNGEDALIAILELRS